MQIVAQGSPAAGPGCQAWIGGTARSRDLGKFKRWSGRWESNPRLKLGKLGYYHYTTPALRPILFGLSGVGKSVNQANEVLRRWAMAPCPAIPESSGGPFS